MNYSKTTYTAKAWLKETIESSRSFVAYRLPNESVASGFAITRACPFQLPDVNFVGSEINFMLAPFDSVHPGLILKGEGEPVALRISDVNVPEIQNDDYNLPASEFLRERYSLAFQRVSEALERGIADKVVLARREAVEPVASDLLPSIFEQLCRLHPHAFVYLVDHPQTGRWMGASPEPFLQKRNGVIETVAQAATRNVNALSEDWSHKELEEQGLVSVFMEEVFGRFGAAVLHKTGPEPTRAGEMVHLKTSYRINADSITGSMGEFVDALHPTPALCGYPKDEALEVIREVEDFSREWYGGFLGPLSKHGFHLFVNIRCMKMTNEATYLYLGGGITRESVEEQEWEETRLKARTLLRAFAHCPKIKL